ncbi:uncharacterized protein LOC111250285 [Varroa destructor]|uniref:Uncharacterized protein n=1 Tax=Varroa destructor TaxID=109461 RepID=A0A7M7K660_VARDE|nr:uncharacterized protein LOC111250285 [Varroa destructor]
MSFAGKARVNEIRFMHSIRFCVGQERGICLKAPRIAGLMEGPNSHDVWRGINPLTKLTEISVPQIASHRKDRRQPMFHVYQNMSAFGHLFKRKTTISSLCQKS